MASNYSTDRRFSFSSIHSISLSDLDRQFIGDDDDLSWHSHYSNVLSTSSRPFIFDTAKCHENENEPDLQLKSHDVRDNSGDIGLTTLSLGQRIYRKERSCNFDTGKCLNSCHQSKSLGGYRLDEDASQVERRSSYESRMCNEFLRRTKTEREGCHAVDTVESCGETESRFDANSNDGFVSTENTEVEDCSLSHYSSNRLHLEKYGTELSHLIHLMNVSERSRRSVHNLKKMMKSEQQDLFKTSFDNSLSKPHRRQKRSFVREQLSSGGQGTDKKYCSTNEGQNHKHAKTSLLADIKAARRRRIKKKNSIPITVKSSNTI